MNTLQILIEPIEPTELNLTSTKTEISDDSRTNNLKKELPETSVFKHQPELQTKPPRSLGEH